MIGNSALLTETPERSLTPPPSEDTVRSQQLVTHRSSPEPDHTGTLILDFQPSEQREENFCYYKPPSLYELGQMGRQSMTTGGGRIAQW